jgi:hypothetical protein
LLSCGKIGSDAHQSGLMHAKLAWARQRLTRYFDDHAAIARLSPDPGCEVALLFS